MFAILVKLVKALNSEQSPRQIAAAVSLAAIVGLTPLLSLHNIIIFLCVLCLRVNLTMFLVSWPLFTIFGLMLEPLAEMIGTSLLQMPALIVLWEGLYNTLIGRWSNFYYANVLGSLIIALVVAVFAFPLMVKFVTQYREKWIQKFEQYHIVKMLQASKFWQLYQA